MRLIPKDIPGRDRGGNAFSNLINAEMLSLLKRSPSKAHLLANDDGTPYIMPARQMNALRQSCPPPYRILSRSTRRTSERLVWIINDPAYWERKAAHGRSGGAA